jgi:peptidoglycan/LPS O-acetylase OafA/YrhL
LDGLDVVLSASLIHAWLPGHAMVLNHQAWSLSVEAFFYLAFPFLFRALVPLRARTSFLLGTGLWFANVLLHVALVNSTTEHDGQSFRDLVYYHPLAHLPTFVFGMTGGLLFEGWRAQLARFSKPLMGGSALLFTLALALPNPLLRYHHDGLFAPLFVAFIFGIAAAPDSWLSRLFARPPLVELGEASYGVYILQYPMFLTFAAVAARLHVNLSPSARLVGFTIFLVFCSVLIFRFLESPARRHIRAITRRRPAIS